MKKFNKLVCRTFVVLLSYFCAVCSVLGRIGSKEVKAADEKRKAEGLEKKKN